MVEQKINVVTLGGGTGHYTLLRALKLIAGISTTAVVSVADSGGSSGLLRDQHGVLPPGDILKAILALSDMDPNFVREFLLHRFADGPFKEHTIGNMLLTMHASYTGNDGDGIELLSKLLCVNEKHKVLPVTFSKIHIHAKYKNGDVLHGEDMIDKYRGEQNPESITITPESAYICNRAQEAIQNADFIIVAPGSLHTSLLPVLLVRGVQDAVESSLAPKIFVCNTMTQKGDTKGYCAHDFIRTLESAMGCKFSFVLKDATELAHDVLERYKEEEQEPVKCKSSCLADPRILGVRLISDGTLIRHDYRLLAKYLREIIQKGFNVSGLRSSTNRPASHSRKLSARYVYPKK